MAFGDFDSVDALTGGLASVPFQSHQQLESLRRLDSLTGTPATARHKNFRSSRADGFEAVYLRAAQAYMLISMPTDTSTILGAFQVIPISH